MKHLSNRTKIIATVGPATNTKDKLWQLYLAGASIFRLNFSHGTHEDHLKVIKYVRELNEENGANICLLQDLQGPKIRTREIENGAVDLHEDDEILITTEEITGNNKRISTTYTGFTKDVNEGDRILIDDGNIELQVVGWNGPDVIAKVIYGGVLKSRKGMNLPNTKISEPSLTEKDRKDLDFGIKHDIDWIALSFVREAADIYELKDIIAESGKDIKVIAKIEKPEAINNIYSIVDSTDAVMVARGDLGVEMPMEEVPMLQKMIVQRCNNAAKPVIIATQMLESMIVNPRPTRAETNDVGNAILDGADVVMLSAETAAGKYPFRAVENMAKTIATVEKDADIFNKRYQMDSESDTFYNDSVVSTACRLAKYVNSAAVVGMTQSGYTAYRIATHRPKGQIFIFTNNKKLLRQMNLVWGVRVFYYDQEESTDKTFSDIKDMLLKSNYVEEGDVIINTASMPLEEKGRTNSVKLTVV